MLLRDRAGMSTVPARVRSGPMLLARLELDGRTLMERWKMGAGVAEAPRGRRGAASGSGLMYGTGTGAGAGVADGTRKARESEPSGAGV